MEQKQIKRPFAVFLEPDPAGGETWTAHVVGPDAGEQVTQGEGPVHALRMTAEALELACAPEDRPTSISLAAPAGVEHDPEATVVGGPPLPGE